MSVVADMPKAKTICELGFNLGHGASTILASLDRPERFYAFDLGEDVVEKVRDRAAARSEHDRSRDLQIANERRQWTNLGGHLQP